MYEPSKNSRIFCNDSHLNYTKFRYQFNADAPLTFDDGYRLSQLPLVAPDHPLVIDNSTESDYKNGRYDKPRYSLIVPVEEEKLLNSRAFLEIDRELREGMIADKISWNICSKRKSKLHVTIAAGFKYEDIELIAKSVETIIKDLGGIRFRLMGPFIGNKNLGRIYFPAYPEMFCGEDSFGIIQDTVKVARTGFYALGYYNLSSELEPEEATYLAKIIADAQGTILAELDSREFIISATNDDLVLSGRIVARICSNGYQINNF